MWIYLSETSISCCLAFYVRLRPWSDSRDGAIAVPGDTCLPHISHALRTFLIQDPPLAESAT